MTDLPDEIIELFRIGKKLREHCYRGRFAPSPTGYLHLGNLRTALASWLSARLNRGEWLLRIDDLDTPRNRLGAVESIQQDLSWLGLDWDGPTIFQSKRRDLYRSVLSALKLQGKLYPCRCTRRLLAQRTLSKGPEIVYPGTCRNLGLSWTIEGGRLPSWRLLVAEEFSRSSGDVLVKRADGFIAYHLATASDELFLGIGEVVRGRDLEIAMNAQLAIIDALNQKPVKYKHVPLWLNSDGRKLSKRQGGDGTMPFHMKEMSASSLIGFLAATLNLVPKGSELSSVELLADLRKDTSAMDILLNTSKINQDTF